MDEFQKQSKRKDGRRAHCKDCIHLWYMSQKEKQREAFVLKKYGKTLNEIEELKAAQFYRCSICGKRCRLVVDHDHATGKFRGLLCADCNMGIGLFKDCIQFLDMAQSYLEKHNAPRQLQG